jgi:hypothetical protein
MTFSASSGDFERRIRDVRKNLIAAALLFSVPFLCSATPPQRKSQLPWSLTGQPDVVTLVNLHPDPRRHTLSSVNYLQTGFIPVCTPVTIESLTSKKMVFRVVETEVEYQYGFHKSLQGSRQEHLDRIFGERARCPSARIAKMSRVDQTGIEQGEATPGMSKDAVVIAIGYPPEHATPSLDLEQWRYWRSRFNTILVEFRKDRVSQIVQ